jgi:hypothetical protein
MRARSLLKGRGFILVMLAFLAGVLFLAGLPYQFSL